MAPSIPQFRFNPARLRSYMLRLPLFTRAVMVLALLAWLVTLFTAAWWDVVAWGALVPERVGLGSSESSFF